MDEMLDVEKKMTRRGKWLCRAGWAAFAVSLALPVIPVFSWVYGLGCLTFVYGTAWESIRWIVGRGQGGASLYYSIFAVANTVLIASPFLMRRFKNHRKWLRRTAILLAAAAMYAASFGVLLMTDGSFTALSIGFYAWLLSFGLVAAGAQHLALGVGKQTINQTRLVTGRTKEELLALQELEAYLGAAGSPAKLPHLPAQEVPGQTESQADRQAEELPNRVTFALGLGS